MSVKFKPMGDGVLIAPVILAKETISPGGIVTMINNQGPSTKGKVVVAGEAVIYVKKGDNVLFGVNAGKDVVVEGVTYKLIKETYLDGFFLDWSLNTINKTLS